ncbi:MAG: hypothetical protein Q9170_000009 [Blastenia crenularia]
MCLKLLVTGGSGFVGSAIIAALQEAHPDWALSILDLQKPVHPRPGVAYWDCDVTDFARLKEIVSKIKPSAIIHAAGMVLDLVDRYRRKARERVFNINVSGTRNILAAAKDNGVIAFSAAEAIVLAASDGRMATCALRPSVVFGPGDPQMIPSLHKCIAKGETPFVIGDGLNMWDVTYVGNVADAHVLAVENLLSRRTAAGEAIFISNEQPLPFRDYCLAIWKEFGHHPLFEVKIPKSLATFAGYLAEWVTRLTGSPSTLSRGSVKDACEVRYCNGIKAREMLGYKPRLGLEEAIRISCADYAMRLKKQER